MTERLNYNISCGNLFLGSSLNASFNSNTVGNLFTTGGSVGIGTSSPSTSFDVSTYMNISSTRGTFVGFNAANGNFGTIECFSTGNALSKLPLCLNPYGGNVGIGSTTPGTNRCLIYSSQFPGSNSPNSTILTLSGGYSSWGLEISNLGEWNLVRFVVNGTVFGSIMGAAGNTIQYNTSSDRRLKENIVDMQNGLDIIKSLKPVQYNFISDPDKTRMCGFVAQDVLPVYPQAVGGNEQDFYGIDYGKFTPVLTSAIQELNKKIESQEQIIQTLLQELQDIKTRLNNTE